jgi:hypothetical protein
MPLIPIGFSIPECKMVADVPSKTKMMSSLIPGVLSTYIYNDEASYYQEYQQSLFAITKKKGGWDCLRHYEILANGTLPYFEDLESCPPQTMTLFPKELSMKCRALYEQWKSRPIESIHRDEYEPIIRELLDHTRNHLTTKKMGQYMLEKSQHVEAKSILFLSGRVDPDYLRCTLLHGLKEHMGANCHDYPKICHLYSDCPIPNHHLYGKGMSYTKTLSPELRSGSDCESDIINDIRAKKYDIVVYGSYTRGIPFYDIVNEYYPPQDVIMVMGEDDRTYDNGNQQAYLDRGHFVFVREI